MSDEEINQAVRAIVESKIGRIVTPELIAETQAEIDAVRERGTTDTPLTNCPVARVLS